MTCTSNQSQASVRVKEDPPGQGSSVLLSLSHPITRAADHLRQGLAHGSGRVRGRASASWISTSLTLNEYAALALCRTPSRCGAVFPSVPCPITQLHGQGDRGDEVDGMSGNAVELLDDDDGCAERGTHWNSRKTHVTPCVCCCYFRYNQAVSLRLHGGSGDVGEIVKSLNDAGLLAMSTLVSCVPRVSNDFSLLVVVCLFTGTGCRDEGSQRKWFCLTLFSQVRLVHLIIADPGAGRWLSMSTSTIDETVTLLRERIWVFFSPYRRQHGWTCNF